MCVEHVAHLAPRQGAQAPQAPHSGPRSLPGFVLQSQGGDVAVIFRGEGEAVDIVAASSPNLNRASLGPAFPIFYYLCA